MKRTIPERDDVILDKAMPYVRSVIALVVFLRYGGNANCSYGVDHCYGVANEFVSEFKKDLEKRKEVER